MEIIEDSGAGPRRSGPVPGQHARTARVLVEVLLLSADSSGVRFRERRAWLRGIEHPDVVARRLAGLPDGPASLIHSTSWRVERGAVVLTYAALPDPAPDRTTPVAPERRAPVSDDALAPCAPGLSPVDVAAHACRHLAYLRHTDDLVGASAAAAPELWRLLGCFTPAVAGLLSAV